MPTDQNAVDLLTRAESYLSALHGSVARHDNLAANFGCAGCELRDQIGVALAAARVSPPATRAADRAELRDRIAEALEQADYRPDMRRGDLADAIMPVLPPADRAAILREAAQRLYTALFPAVYDDMGQKAAEGVNRAVSELRRMADEAQQTEPEAPCCSDPTCTCNQVNAEGRCDCTKWESGPQQREAQQQPETQAEEIEPDTPEKAVRDHVLALHQIGEQLAGIESWFWKHLADVRDAAVAQPGKEA